eukprot:6239376-Amphidinium_carterae.1
MRYARHSVSAATSKSANVFKSSVRATSEQLEVCREIVKEMGEASDKLEATIANAAAFSANLSKDDAGTSVTHTEFMASASEYGLRNAAVSIADAV